VAFKLACANLTEQRGRRLGAEGGSPEMAPYPPGVNALVSARPGPPTRVLQQNAPLCWTTLARQFFWGTAMHSIQRTLNTHFYFQRSEWKGPQQTRAVPRPAKRGIVWSFGITALLVLPTALYAAGTWSIKSAAPTGRMHAPATVVNGKIYLVGGSQGGFNPTNLPTEIYDPVTDTWTSGAPVGFVAAGVAAAINGKIYHAGGCNNADCNSPTNALRIYDPSTDTWTSGAPMPTARGIVTGGAINGKLYVTAGVTNSAVVEIYDPATNTWSTGAPMPLATARWDAAGVVFNNMLYVMGGTMGGASRYTRVDVYDPVTNTWGVDTSLPTGIAGAGAAVLNGRIHVVGGTTSTATVNTHFVLDPLTHTWALDTPMPTARFALSGASVGTTLYAIAGLPDGPFNPTGANEAFQEPLPPTTPTAIQQCKNGGWRDFLPLFRNQGQCVSFVNHLN
jgi:N-acetylneuraminic acid mutarotase